MSNNYNVPILFVFFNRIDIAKKSFAKIAKIKPSKLYLASDGGRSEKEMATVNKLRDIILSSIDWECEVKTLFQEDNLGCSLGVSTAINWLFANEEMGIILEDDCLVQNSFFPFMSKLLNRYKSDLRIGMIDGANYIKKVKISDSYCFSKYKSTNGWGTWRRSWDKMDMNMQWREGEYYDSVIANMGYRSKDLKYWKYHLKVIDAKEASAWDWQWYFTLSTQNQLSVFPKVSLVSNIGFGEGATHTQQKNTPKRYITDEELSFPLKHPLHILPYDTFDKAFYKDNNSILYTIKRYIPFGIKRILKKILR